MKINHFAIVLLAVTALSSCDKNTPIVEKSHGTPLPLRIDVGVGGVENISTLQAKFGTKSSVITDVKFGNEEKINVILVNDGQGITAEYPRAALFQCKTTEVGGVINAWNWSFFDINKPLQVTINPAQVLAHYPAVLTLPSKLSDDMKTLALDLPNEIPYGDYSSLNFNAIKITLNVGGEKEVWFAKNDDDYMIGTGANAVSALNPMANTEATTINMKHILSMVVIQVKMEQGSLDANSKISGISIENVQGKTALQKGSFNMLTQAFTKNGTEINYKRPMSEFNQNTYFGLLVYPAAISAGDVVIKCSVGPTIYTYPVAAINWVSGGVYLYNITLSAASGAMTGDVKILDWPTTKEIKVPIE